MPEDPFLQSRPRPIAAAVEAPHSPREAFDWYQDFLEKHRATSTRSTAVTEIERFLTWAEANEVDVLQQQRGDGRWYLDTLEGRCTHFRRGRTTGGANHTQVVPNYCCIKPNLNCPGCPDFEGMNLLTIESAFASVRSFSKWLLGRGYIEVDVLGAEGTAWASDTTNARKKLKAKRASKRPQFSEDTVRTWVLGCDEQPWRFTIYWQARYGLRASELQRLSINPEFLDPELNWFIVPLASKNDGKRKLLLKYPINPEAKRHLMDYLEWRTQVMIRVHGDPNHHQYLTIVNREAKPLANAKSLDAAKSINAAYSRIAEYLGIQPKNPSQSQVFTSHSLRRIFTNRIRKYGTGDPSDKKLLRGDWAESEAIDSYEEKEERLLEIFTQASPPFGC